MAEVVAKLGAYRKLNPTPLEEFIFTIIPAGAHGFEWRWIGRQQIYLRGEV